MRDFAFLEPTTASEASRMLADLGDECRVMAGGTALMLAMRQRMLSPSHIVSISQIASLRGISFDPVLGLRIGALERHADIANSPIVARAHPMLAAMAEQVANPQVRNQGTIGGNLCYADPATDPPDCLMALNAQVVLASSRGQRIVPMTAFFVDYYLTAIEPDELVLEIRVPPPPADGVGLYTRFRRTAAEHRPMASVALHVRRSGRHCHELRLAVGAATPIPCRIPEVERFLSGKVVDADAARLASDMTAQSILAVSDARGSESYRRHVVGVLTRRAIAQVFQIEAEALE